MARKVVKKKRPPAARSSTRAKLLLLSQAYTTAQIARMIGASPRSVRRYKNEGKEPKGAKQSKRLQKAFAKEREHVQAEARRDRKKHPRAIRRTELPPVRGTRRKLKERRIDPKTGEAKATGREVDSDWINYDVRGWNIKELHALLVRLWQSGGNRDVQFIYQIPAGGRYPASGGKPGREVRKSTRSGSPPIPLSRTGTTPVPFQLIETEGELLDLLLRFIDAEQGPKSRHMVYIAVNDAGVKTKSRRKKK